MSSLPQRDVGAFGLIDETLEAVGELDATALNADQDEIVGTAAAFDDLGGHADERPAERPVVEEESPGGHRGRKLATRPGRGNVSRRLLTSTCPPTAPRAACPVYRPEPEAYARHPHPRARAGRLGPCHQRACRPRRDDLRIGSALDRAGQLGHDLPAAAIRATVTARLPSPSTSYAAARRRRRSAATDTCPGGSVLRTISATAPPAPCRA